MMPTPSAPDPQTPYTFSSTCPDNDESSRSHLPQRHEPRVNHHDSHAGDDSRSNSNNNMPPDATTAHEDSPSQPIAIPHFITSGASFAASVHASSPLSANVQGVAYHKPADDEPMEQSQSPYGSSPIESIQTSRPRHGVGTTSQVSTGLKVERAAHKLQDIGCEYATEEHYSLPSMGSGFPNRRVIPNSPSTFLRAGSRFTGTQQSERQVYQVQVEIKYLDLRESFLCGYLRIQGLTDDHPTLTTYFEGEIINGTKYGFLTKHADWGANDKTDLTHWAKFPAFRPYSKQARRNAAAGSSASVASSALLLNNAVVSKDVAQSEHVFMRWKEHFLVPDHRVRTITGASFEGFYYIAFNQVLGEVNGIYFHSKSERFQQLELKHVEDRGCFSALEFR